MPITIKNEIPGGLIDEASWIGGRGDYNRYAEQARARQQQIALQVRSQNLQENARQQQLAYQIAENENRRDFDAFSQEQQYAQQQSMAVQDDMFRTDTMQAGFGQQERMVGLREESQERLSAIEYAAKKAELKRKVEYVKNPANGFFPDQQQQALFQLNTELRSLGKDPAEAGNLSDETFPDDPPGMWPTGITMPVMRPGVFLKADDLRVANADGVYLGRGNDGLPVFEWNEVPKPLPGQDPIEQRKWQQEYNQKLRKLMAEDVTPEGATKKVTRSRKEAEAILEKEHLPLIGTTAETQTKPSKEMVQAIGTKIRSGVMPSPEELDAYNVAHGLPQGAPVQIVILFEHNLQIMERKRFAKNGDKKWMDLWERNGPTWVKVYNENITKIKEWVESQ